MMINRLNNTDVNRKPRVGQCPTCGQHAQFIFIGEQRWPPRVVAATGVGPTVHLWMCSRCQTTLTETAVEVPG